MKTFIYISLAALTFLPVVSCVYHELDSPALSATTDGQLFDEVNKPGYEFYQGGNILSPASASPHGNFKLRFNEEALSSLDPNGELPEGGRFAEGSIIVKEVIVNNEITVLAVMKKAAGDASSGEGWLWSEYRPNGEVLYGIAAKGSVCISCHDDLPNRNLVRTFDLH